MPECIGFLPLFPWPHVPGVELHDAKCVAEETVARFARDLEVMTVGRSKEWRASSPSKVKESPTKRDYQPEADGNAMTRHLHVFCGGGTGSHLLRLLHDSGAIVSAGFLASTDSDAETCRALGFETVTVPNPGAPSPEVLSKVRHLLRTSEAVVLTPFAVGRSNLANLELALELPEAFPIFLLSGSDFSKRDYTGGEATVVYRQLEARARGRSSSATDLVRLLFASFPDARPVAPSRGF